MSHNLLLCEYCWGFFLPCNSGPPIKSQLINFFENLVPGRNMHILRKLSASFFLIMRITWLTVLYLLLWLSGSSETNGKQQLLAHVPGFYVFIFSFIWSWFSSLFFLVLILYFNFIGIIVYVLVSDIIFFVEWVEYKHTNSAKTNTILKK